MDQKDLDKGFKEGEGDPIELAAAAQCNFENVARTNPALAQHPIFMIAMAQLKGALAKLTEA